MLKLYNTFGRKLETFRPVDPKLVSVFTCGPSVYMRPHIGNMRTFLFEDILVRYLKYSGYAVRRGMTVTDVEDKAIREARKEGISLKKLTDRNMAQFLRELRQLGMLKPDYLPRASDYVKEAADMIDRLLKKKIAYRYEGNIYFDPLKFRGFGKLYGLDMKQWPSQKRRFHQDTYPGIQWNLGDFVLWHGYREGDAAAWDTKIGKGRPSWNIQDPAMVAAFFGETLSFYCGGIDNLYRHHDYSVAILESLESYPMARYWLHGAHLFVEGSKMSKSKGNIVYVDTLLERGYSAQEVRFLLMYGHYRKRLNFSEARMRQRAEVLRAFKLIVGVLGRIAGRTKAADCNTALMIREAFAAGMDNDLNVKAAFDGMACAIAGMEIEELTGAEAAGILKALKETDEVLRVIF